MLSIFERRVLVLRHAERALDVSLCLTDSVQSFSFQRERFTAWTDSAEANNFGFYDWLRKPSEEIMGIRVGFLEKIPDWFRELKIQDAIIDERSLVITVYFGDSRVIDELHSNDQILGDVKLFRGSNGSVALGVNHEVTCNA